MATTAMYRNVLTVVREVIVIVFEVLTGYLRLLEDEINATGAPLESHIGFEGFFGGAKLRLRAWDLVPFARTSAAKFHSKPPWLLSRIDQGLKPSRCGSHYWSVRQMEQGDAHSSEWWPGGGSKKKASCSGGHRSGEGA
jgi:hypothetical protein